MRVTVEAEAKGRKNEWSAHQSCFYAKFVFKIFLFSHHAEDKDRSRWSLRSHFLVVRAIEVDDAQAGLVLPPIQARNFLQTTRHPACLFSEFIKSDRKMANECHLRQNRRSNQFAPQFFVLNLPFLMPLHEWRMTMPTWSWTKISVSIA